MSFDALAWAAKQNPGSSGTKLVLLGLAECADRMHALAFPSIAALVEFTCLDRKSVIANLARLEESGFITDTGRKVGQTGQIKVWQINVETIPKTEQYQKRNSSEITPKRPKNGTRNKSEPVNGVTSVTPSGRNAGKHLLPSDWVLPAIADLPPKARACAELWTRESYETHGEAFESYWRSRRGMYSDWVLTWGNRVIALHSQVMRDQKHGNAPPSAAATTAGRQMTAEEQRAYVEHVARKFGRMAPDATPPAERIGKPITLASLAAAQVGGPH